MKTLTYKGMTVEQGAAHVFKTLRQWSDEAWAKARGEDWQAWLNYVRSPERGEYRGFAALHDKCDANMLLPFAEDCAMTDEETEFHAAVIETVTELIIRGDYAAG